MNVTNAAAYVVPVTSAWKHTSTVILSHGLGDTGSGWSFLGRKWRAENRFPSTKFVFPNAPAMPVTVNFGMNMPAWFDIIDMENLLGEEDEEGILKSQQVFHSWIESEEKSCGVKAENVVIGGFSQGGILSILAGLTHKAKIGGIFGLSSCLALRDKFQSLVPENNPNKDTPIFMGQGDVDPVVKPEWGQRTADKLREWGYTVDLKMYKGMGHSASDEEIADLERYLESRLPKPESITKGAL